MNVIILLIMLRMFLSFTLGHGMHIDMIDMSKVEPVPVNEFSNILIKLSSQALTKINISGRVRGVMHDLISNIIFLVIKFDNTNYCTPTSSSSFPE